MEPRLTVDGIVCLPEGVVLITRGHGPFKGWYALPGGFVEHESTERAVVREVWEETGLRTEVDRLVGVYSQPGRDPRGHIVTVVYDLKIVGGRLVDGKPFPLDELPPLAFDHQRIIDDWRRSARK